ncbi:hypothetical protein JMJ77_0013976 [Colletotrichum scovillei]|uniref:Uncharacterized protein n=1 Tax=Colletotrichum scovillei TaxID=1209932 RepID=A0A9P7R2H2_9PEZI|nr:hypothetical protein JMJ77_0013976 [Colletotrichum scovillei]KAG7065499.1 hypothetical protein JMJ78_0012252 [Colletotrichum scovillei]KAG7068099.1 hypothetical protein JMJ76_0007795 [Colletotrichum scovillei]
MATDTAVPFFTEHDGSPIIEDTRKSPPLSTKSSPSSSSDKPFATPNGDNALPRYLSLTHDLRHAVQAQAPETPNDHNYGEQTPGNWPLIASESTPPSAEVEYSSTSKTVRQAMPTTTNNLADSHRKSKTEFNSIPSELLHMSSGLTSGPDTRTQAHRKSSTEFKEVSDMREDVGPLDFDLQEPANTPSEGRRDEERRTTGQLWRKPESQDSAQLWKSNSR